MQRSSTFVRRTRQHQKSRREAPETKVNVNKKPFLVFMNLKAKQSNETGELIMRQKHRRDKSRSFKSGGAT